VIWTAAPPYMFAPWTLPPDTKSYHTKDPAKLLGQRECKKKKKKKYLKVCLESSRERQVSRDKPLSCSRNSRYHNSLRQVAKPIF
jgi:hypothetical protein